MGNTGKATEIRGQMYSLLIAIRDRTSLVMATGHPTRILVHGDIVIDTRLYRTHLVHLATPA